MRTGFPVCVHVALLGLLANGWAAEMASEPKAMACDVCVVGGGSGGFGAALAAARGGVKVVLLEKQPRLGGTSTSAFVANWEPGPGEAFAAELYKRLSAIDGAVAIAARVHSYKPNEPYGLAYGVQGSALTYADTLKRAGLPENRQCSVVMRPEALAEAMLDLLKEAGVRVLLETSFEEAEAGEGTLRAIRTANAKGERGRIEAKVFIDATGGGHLCRAIGCEAMLGIREGHRIVTEYILTEQDVRTGVKASSHKDLMAVADHALDIHGGSHGAKELKESYGIPYRCLIPKGWTNLLIAGRCAGFSHIAASSCRLSRTMMALGHAAGLAAVEVARDGKDVRAVDVAKVQKQLGLQP